MFYFILFYFCAFLLKIVHVWFPRFRPSEEPDAKKLKMDQRKAPGQDTKEVGVKMIELDFASSDEEL